MNNTFTGRHVGDGARAAAGQVGKNAGPTVTPVRSRAQIARVAALAQAIWTDHYTPIIGPAQVAYMLATFQSKAAIAAQIAEGGYAYYLVTLGNDAVGYMAVVPGEDRNRLMLSKLYVRRDCRGRGVGRAMLAFAEQLGREQNRRTLWLTVNRHNRTSIAWYRRMGFRKRGDLRQAIGAGFVMDDFRMEKRVAARREKT